MGFADRYIHALSASNLKDDALNSQAEPLIAAALAAAAVGDLGTLLHRAKYAGTTARDMAKALEVRTHVEKELVEAIRKKDASREADCRQALLGDLTALENGVVQVARLLRVWTAEVTKRGRARRWVPENTAWDAEAALKLYRTVAEHSLAHWLSGGGPADLALSAGFVREHVLNMVSELHGILDGHSARAASKLRAAA